MFKRVDLDNSINWNRSIWFKRTIYGCRGNYISNTSFKNLGLQSLSLNINNLGCSKCRPNYNEALKNYLKENFDNLCPLCQSRFEKNPMRILDCKERSVKEITKNAPIILDTCVKNVILILIQLKVFNSIKYTIYS